MATGAETDESQAVSFLRTIVEAGIENVYVTDLAEARRLTTEKRLEVLSVLAEEEVDSKRDLARRLDRDISIVSRDLDVLWEAGVIDYEEQGSAKRPVLVHETILTKPIMWRGEVFEG